jgi:GxxExxY protein
MRRTAEDPAEPRRNGCAGTAWFTEPVIGLAIDVHRELGPGLPESAYETCLGLVLKQAGISFKRQAPIPIVYRGIHLDTGLRADFLIAEGLIVEIKAVERLLPMHGA